MSQYEQLEVDGRIVRAEEPTGPDANRIKEIIRGSLNSNHWNMQWSEFERSKPFHGILSNTGLSIDLYIYCWRASNGGRVNRPFEKRIQIGACSDIGFNRNNTETEKTLLLGIYERNNSPLIIGWQSENNRNHGASKSCFTNTTHLSNALRDGFAQDYDSYGNLICAFRPEFLQFYIVNLHKLHSLNFLDNSVSTSTNFVSTIPESLNPYCGFSRNRILYGAPGTGKSYKLNKDIKGDGALVNFKDQNVTRVTFHPSYTYGQFVGTYKPVPIYVSPDKTPGEDRSKIHDNNLNEDLIMYKADKQTKINEYMEPRIDYRLVAGPFLEVLCKSLKNPQDRYLFIIEEINRTNIASIFGDVFQLLDRDEHGDSEYSITFNEDIMNYIRKELEDTTIEAIRIPNNMYIWATMNSADQGVSRMDTAFKRRWEFEYLPIDGDIRSEEKINSMKISLPFVTIDPEKRGNIRWNSFRKLINTKLSQPPFNVSEDKLIGPFFLKENELNNVNSIKNKLILYLRDDILRHRTTDFFKETLFSEIVNKFDKGENIFKKEVISDDDLKNLDIVED